MNNLRPFICQCISNALPGCDAPFLGEETACASRRGDRGQSISAQDEKAQDYLNQPLLDSVRPILLIMYMYIEKDGQGGAYSSSSSCNCQTLFATLVPPICQYVRHCTRILCNTHPCVYVRRGFFLILLLRDSLLCLPTGFCSLLVNKFPSLCLRTFDHLLIVKKFSLSLSLSTRQQGRRRGGPSSGFLHPEAQLLHAWRPCIAAACCICLGFRV